MRILMRHKLFYISTIASLLNCKDSFYYLHLKTTLVFCKMISYIFCLRIYRLRLGLAYFCAIILVTLLMTVEITYFRSTFETDGDESDARRVAEWQWTLAHETCHMSREGDALELLTSNVTIPEDSIFFHETSCKGDLTSRQACVVESAAKAHPNRQINLFFTSAVSENTLKNGSVSTLLNNYQNVKLSRVLIEDYANGTPIATRIAHMPSEDINIHMSKIMKFLTLYKYSGIYLSLDVIVARKLDLWKNWAVKESPHTLSSDMFAFSKNKAGRKLAEYALGILLNELAISGRHDPWSFGSPSVIQHLLEYWCSSKEVEYMEFTKCNDVAVYGPELFYPISFHDRKKYFHIVDWDNRKDKSIFTYFVWHRFTKYNLVTPGSLYGRIANAFCPITYQRYSDDAGVWYPELDGVLD